MRLRIFRVCVMLMCLLTILPGLPALVMANETEPPGESAESIIKSYNISVFTREPEKQVIHYFDVNEKGWIAVGHLGSRVCIYDENGVFQYGYNFGTQGDYGIAFEGDNLAIYFVRSDIIAVLDPEGNCIRAESKALSGNRLKNQFQKTAKQVGNTQYFLERDVGFFEGFYPRVVSVDETGNRKILYDVTVKGYIVGIGEYLLLFGMLAFIPLIIRSKFREEDRANSAPDEAEE